MKMKLIVGVGEGGFWSSRGAWRGGEGLKVNIETLNLRVTNTVTKTLGSMLQPELKAYRSFNDRNPQNVIV